MAKKKGNRNEFSGELDRSATEKLYDIAGVFMNEGLIQADMIPRFHVLEPEKGKRQVLLENGGRQCHYVSINAVAEAMIRWNPERAELSPRQASEAARIWLALKEPLAKMPKALAMLDEDVLCFNRVPIRREEWSFDTPLWMELESRTTNFDALSAFVGSLFFEEADKQQYLWLFGEGRNGKGSILRLIRRLLGSAFHAEIVPRADDRFWTSGLLGKRLVAFPDTNTPTFPQSGLFKQLTGNDAVRIEQKGKDVYSTILTTKFIFLSNDELQLSSEEADMRRAIYCKIDPIPVASDPKYDDKLWAEAPRILDYCIGKYEDTVTQHGTIPVDVKSQEEISENSDDLMREFWESHFEFDESLRCQPGTVQNLLKINGIKSVRNQSKYIRFLSREFLVKKRTVAIPHKGPRKMYVGMNIMMPKEITYINKEKEQSVIADLNFPRDYR